MRRERTATRPAERSRRHLRLVRPRRPRPPRRLPFFLLAFLVASVLVTGIVSAQAMVSQNSFRLEQLAQRSAELESRQGELRLQVATLSEPSRIAAEARSMGLRSRSDATILEIRGEPEDQASDAAP
jgi:cell division protein FtsL